MWPLFFCARNLFAAPLCCNIALARRAGSYNQLLRHGAVFRPQGGLLPSSFEVRAGGKFLALTAIRPRVQFDVGSDNEIAVNSNGDCRSPPCGRSKFGSGIDRNEDCRSPPCGRV